MRLLRLAVTATRTNVRSLWTEQRFTKLPKVNAKPVVKASARLVVFTAIGLSVAIYCHFVTYVGYYYPAAHIHARDPATKGFFLQQTMMRIKDPRPSLDFYTKVLGMTLLKRMDFTEQKFTLYFMGYEDVSEVPKDEHQRTKWALSRPGTLELTHNYGTESDPNQKYHNGNTDPRGYGHIGIAVDDVYAACKRFDELNVEYVKRPDAGTMKGLAFIKDPDGYWIEIFSPHAVADC